MGLAKLYGCVVLEQFAVQAMLRGRPELQGRAVVVMDGVRPMEWVLAMNGKAAGLGVRTAMTRTEVETFGAVEILSRSMAEEEAAKEILRGEMGRFTPRLELRAETSRWACVLDLSGSERLLGEPAVLGRKLEKALGVLGFDAGVVLCANEDAGLSLARMGVGCRVVAEGEEAHALKDLPVGVLELAPEQEERLALWGIATLGELAALPEVKLIARMGQAGRQLRLRARGELPHHFEPVNEAFCLEETLEFEEPVETLEPLLFCMNVMLERMAGKAEEHALALASVKVSLWMERGSDRVVGEEDIAEERPAVMAQREQPVVMESRAEEAVGVGEHGFEARLGMASADAAVRKAWHRAALLGKRPPLDDAPPVRGEALRERLGIGDGQAMRRKAAGLRLVRGDEASAAEMFVPAKQSIVKVQDDVPARPRTNPKLEAGKWGQVFERTVQPAVPTLDRRLLLKMLQLDLEANPAPGNVIRLQLWAVQGRAGKIQLGLFSPPTPEPTRFEDTYARLRSMMGETNVGRAKALDTHEQEGFLLERFVLPADADGALAEDMEAGTPALTLRRIRPPLQANVVLQNKQVSNFWFGGMRFDASRSYGPWRTSGKWWGPEVWSMDVWDVAGRSDRGDLLVCLLGFDLFRERWSLHGIYD